MQPRRISSSWHVDVDEYLRDCDDLYNHILERLLEDVTIYLNRLDMLAFDLIKAMKDNVNGTICLDSATPAKLNKEIEDFFTLTKQKPNNPAPNTLGMIISNPSDFKVLFQIMNCIFCIVYLFYLFYYYYFFNFLRTMYIICRVFTFRY